MTGPQAAAEGSPTEENSAAAERESTATENSNADCNSTAAAADDPSLASTTQTDPAVNGAEASDTSGGGLGSAYRTPTGERSAASRGSADSTDSNADNSDASGGASGDTPPDKVENTVVGILRILGLQRRTKKYLEDNYPTLHELEEFLQLSSEEIRATMAQVKEEREEDGGEYDKTDEKAPAIFNQADRERLILLGRWKNNRGDGQKNKLEDFNKESFNAFAHNVDYNILDEILNELKLSKEAKDKIKKEKVFTPAIFVEKSKYWYKHEIALNDADIYEIEKFKKWYKYQLDIYLPSDWIMSFRKEATQVKELEWRKVLRAIGLKADAIQALEINDVCDFATLNETSKEWKISEPREWKKLGLKKNGARHIINFRHWHNFYVAGKKDKSDWAAEFSSAQYENFVQRYINPSKPDEFKKPGLWALRSDKLKIKTSMEKQNYCDMLVAAAEDGAVSKMQRYHLRQHYKERREKMELIQEINERVGDSSFQEQRLGEIFEKEAINDHEKKTRDLMFDQRFYQFFFSAMLVYLLLAAWLGTTIYFIVEAEDPDRANLSEYRNFLRENPGIIEDYLLSQRTRPSLPPSLPPTPLPSPPPTVRSTNGATDGATPTVGDVDSSRPTAYSSRPTAAPSDTKGSTVMDVLKKWISNFKGFEYVTFIHNVVFGLVTAVVIQELGEEVKKKSLYHRFQETYRERLKRSKEARFRARLKLRRHCSCRNLCYKIRGCLTYASEWCKSFLTGLILNSARIYIFFWILLGVLSLSYGAIKGLNTDNPLYTTGQTWLGIAVTIGYSYFGLNGKNIPTIEDAKDENDQRIKDAVQRAIGGDGANGGEEAKFTDERGGTKVIRTYHELMNEIGRYKGLLEKAEGEQYFHDAAGYQKCLDQLEELKSLLPTVEVLESQLKEAQDKRDAAVAKEDIDDEDKYNKAVIKLKKKVKEEKDAKAAAAGGDASTI